MRPSGPSCGDDGVKNPDFLLYPRFGIQPGRRGEGQAGQEHARRRDWENWVTTDDLDGLVRWQAMFGPGFRAVLAFAYAEPIQPFPLPGDNGPTNSGASSIGSGRSVSTTTSPTSARAGRPGRPSPWPGGRFAAGFAPYSNGCP